MREPIRGGQEPGRNDKCPCGSGKKYKKCHMPKQTVVPPTPDEQAMMDAVSPMIISPETLVEGMAKGKSVGEILKEAQDMLDQARVVPAEVLESPEEKPALAEAQAQVQTAEEVVDQARKILQCSRALGKSTSLPGSAQVLASDVAAQKAPSLLSKEEVDRRIEQMVKDTAHAGD